MKKLLTAIFPLVLCTVPAMAEKKLTFSKVNTEVFQYLFNEYCGANSKQALSAFNAKYDKASGIENKDMLDIVFVECGLCKKVKKSQKRQCDDNKAGQFLLDIISLTDRVYNANYQFYPSELMIKCAEHYRKIVEPIAKIQKGTTVKDTVVNSFEHVFALLKYLIQEERKVSTQNHVGFCNACFASGLKKQTENCNYVLNKDILNKEFDYSDSDLKTVREYYAKYADCVFQGQELQCKDYYVNNKFTELPERYTLSCKRIAESKARQSWSDIQQANHFSLAEHFDARDAFDKFWILNTCDDYGL